LNPDNLHRLTRLGAELDEIAASDRIPLDDLALEALLAEARPQSTPIEEGARIGALLAPRRPRAE